VLFYRLKSGGMKETETLKILGATSLVESVGARKLRSMLGDSQRRRIAEALNALDATDCYLYDNFRLVERSIAEQKPAKLTEIEK
ncbi:MAG: hypothetical protein LBO78_01625, partial [Rickettsiales bacterium]|jgi:hypothetical protein|nr:hypothetical protein [Rickettsiales bacterium]